MIIFYVTFISIQQGYSHIWFELKPDLNILSYFDCDIQINSSTHVNNDLKIISRNVILLLHGKSCVTKQSMSQTLIIMIKQYSMLYCFAAVLLCAHHSGSFGPIEHRFYTKCPSHLIRAWDQHQELTLQWLGCDRTEPRLWQWQHEILQLDHQDAHSTVLSDLK